MKPSQIAKKVDKLSVPLDRPSVERGVAPNDKEHHNLFAAFLRDPSPISPDRALEHKRGNSRQSRTSGAFSARITGAHTRNLSPEHSYMN